MGMNKTARKIQQMQLKIAFHMKREGRKLVIRSIV